MSTIDNIKEAYSGESQANRKYSVFSEKAKAEGFNNVSKLFLAASEAEAIHAKRLLFVADNVGTTEENLNASIKGETEEYENMYPSFIETANAENNSEAVRIFTHAMKAEEVHAGLYKKAAEAIKNSEDLEASAIFLCPVCGNVTLNSAPDVCSICGAPKRMFREIQ